MKKYVSYGEHKFEIVESVPKGYFIWNIGKNMVDGYLPLCKLKEIQDFKGGKSIELDTLKAIKIKDSQKILEATKEGGGTLKSIKRYVAKYKNHKNAWKSYCADGLEKIIPVLETIKWD